MLGGDEPACNFYYPPVPIPLSGLRFGIPDALVTDNLVPAVAAAFERSVTRLSKAGVRIEDVSMPDLDELATVGRVRFPSMVEGYADR